MKKLFSKLAILLSIALYSACSSGGSGGDNNPPEEHEPELTLNVSKITLDVDETFQLVPSISYYDKTPAYTYTSRNPEIASVDDSGLITGISKGSSIIKVQVEKYSAICEVTVEEIIIPVLTLTLSHTEITMYDDETFTIEKEAHFGEEIVEPVYSYTGYDNEVIDINDDGEIVAKKEGNTELTITASYNQLTDSKVVAVSILKTNYQLVPSITDLEIVVGEPVDLSYSIIKRNEIVTTLDNDDPNLAIEIDEPTNAEIVDGKLNGLMKGNIKLNATYTYLGNDLVSSISLRVREKYTVSYYAHGELVHEEVVLDGDNITYVPESNKEGHVFKCWIKNGQPFSSPIESNIKVSAMWEVDKYDYNQGLYGALTYVRSNESNNSEPEIATDEPDFGNGLKYSLPQVADSDYNVIVLPKVDYSEVAKTTFTFKMSGWTFVGPTNEQRWYDAGSTLSGTINVLSLASGVQVIMQEKTHGSFMITIDDNDVLHGNKSLTLSATCLGGTQYFYLSKPNMNYSDEMFYDFTTSNYGGYIELTNDTSVQKSFQVTENGLSVDVGDRSNKVWAVYMPKISYSAFEKVTIEFCSHAAWAGVGLTSSAFIGNTSSILNGTIVFANNGNGYSVSLDTTNTTEHRETVITDIDVLSGKESFVIYFQAEAYRTLKFTNITVE